MLHHRFGSDYGILFSLLPPKLPISFGNNTHLHFIKSTDRDTEQRGNSRRMPREILKIQYRGEMLERRVVNLLIILSKEYFAKSYDVIQILRVRVYKYMLDATQFPETKANF